MSIRRRSNPHTTLLLVGLVGLVGDSVVGWGGKWDATARADEDAMAPYRDRFRQGMEKYKGGATAEAIRIWNAIYEEIGPERGYRLSFDLARAYEANFETSRAAERYQSFVDWVKKRQAAGERLDAIVLREADEAVGRIEDLNATNGRIRILPEGSTVLTQIDSADPRLGSFVAYVAPGTHVVAFAPRTDAEERREVTVKAGEVIDVAPAPRPEIPFPPVGDDKPSAPPPPLTQVRRLELQHPFSPVVLYIAMGTTALSVLVPVATYAHAYSLISTHNSTATSTNQKIAIEAEYPRARTDAYATLSIPITLGAVTAGLVGYYFAGAKEHEVRISAEPLPGGGAAGVVGSF